MRRRKITIIGSGVAGLSAASYLAKAGQKVTLLEKKNTTGGRARHFQAEGFLFDKVSVGTGCLMFLSNFTTLLAIPQKIFTNSKE